jgi:hypothetical protein
MMADTAAIMASMRLDLRRDPIPQIRLPARFLHGSLESALLHGLIVAVEGVAGIAHDLAGSGDVSELFSEAQQSDLVFDDLLFCTHWGVALSGASAPVVSVHNQGNLPSSSSKSVRSDWNYCR